MTGSQLLGNDAGVDQPLLLSEDDAREHFEARLREQKAAALEAQLDSELAALEARGRKDED